MFLRSSSMLTDLTYFFTPRKIRLHIAARLYILFTQLGSSPSVNILNQDLQDEGISG